MVEVGVLIMVMFTLLILVVMSVVIRSNREAYLSGKSEKMDNEARLMVENSFRFTNQYQPILNAIGWAFNYARLHPKEIKELKMTTDDYIDMIYDENDMELPYAGIPEDPEFYEQLPEDKKVWYAAMIYNIVGMHYGEAYVRTNNETENYTYFFIDIHPETKGMVYYYGYEYDEGTDEIYKYKYIGDYMPEITPSEDAIQVIRSMHKSVITTVYERKQNTEGEQLLVNYIPVIYTREDGQEEILGVMGVCHNWQIYYQIFVDSIFKWTMYSIIGLIIAEVVILSFIYKTVLRPMKHIQKGLRSYIESKDHKVLEKDMEKIRQNNEVGVISRDILDISEKYEKYMEDSIRIAGEKERVSAELELATRFQNEMLPKDFPDNPHYDLYALMRPAREVGGDFYDFFMLDDIHLAFLIADVSDKGMSAAFFMAVSKTLINSRAQMGGDPVKILEYVDHWLENNNSLGQFVTVWIGILNTENGELSICNAGHDYPAILQDGEDFVIEKTEHGHPIAFFPGMSVPQKGYKLQLHPGDRVFLYTDGVLDEKRADGERFEKERLLQALNMNKDLGSKDLLNKVLDTVLEFGGAEGQFDDITMMEMTYKG